MENVSEVLTFVMSDELTIEVNQGVSNTSVTGAAAVNGQDPTTASSICEATMPEACQSIEALRVRDGSMKDHASTYVWQVPEHAVCIC